MQQTRKYRFRQWLLIVFAFICVTLNLGVFYLYEKNESVVESKEWVNHTYSVINTVDSMYFALQDMQIAVRGYLLSEDKKFLAPYYRGADMVDAKYELLISMTRDNPARQEQLRDLKKNFEDQRTLMRKQIRLRQNSGVYSLQDMARSRALMEKMRELSAQILKEEQELLAKRSAQEHKRLRNFMTSIFATAGISILGLLVANGIITFLTMRRLHAEADLRRINKELEGFTYIASHDLKAPLVNMRGFASEMTASLKDIDPYLTKAIATLPETDRKMVETILHKDIPDSLGYIHASVDKMNNLTNGILELSRLGKRNLKIEPVNVDKLVQRTLDSMQHQIATKGITIRVGKLPNVITDSLSLEQIFGNIIDNAIKYLDPQRPGVIEIGSHQNRNTTTFWVEDNGRGIREDDIQKIFEIYRRAGNNAHIPGDGLGMSHVRTMLRRLKGRIWCESKLNVGTTFYFTLATKLEKEAPVHD